MTTTRPSLKLLRLTDGQPTFTQTMAKRARQRRETPICRAKADACAPWGTDRRTSSSIAFPLPETLPPAEATESGESTWEPDLKMLLELDEKARARNRQTELTQEAARAMKLGIGFVALGIATYALLSPLAAAAPLAYGSFKSYQWLAKRRAAGSLTA